MTTSEGGHITGHITGDVSGQVAIGSSIRQDQQRDVSRVEVTAQDREAAQALFDELKAMVLAQAPEDKETAALERVEELEQAVTAPEPKISTMEYVKDWFADNLPKLAGAVTSVVLHPIVGKLVQAGGDMATAEFRRRFGPRAGA